MKKSVYLFLVSIFILCHSCMKDEDYTTSPDALLAFSLDTLSFDTVIAGVPANTHTFAVYNPNGKAIRISRVWLEGGANSAFRVNVDGTFLSGGSAMDFEILEEDSLRVFVEMTAPNTNSDTPVEAADKLSFLTEGGALGTVVLKAYGQEVIPLNGLIIERDTTLSAARPYRVLDSLVVAPGATLTLEAGVRLYFHPDASLLVHGTLKTKGEPGNMVMMRGDRLGNMFSNQPYDRIPAQWGGVVFSSSSYGNHLDFTDIHSATFGIRCDSSDVAREKLKVENSIIWNTAGDAVCLKSCNTFWGNTEIANAGGNTLTVMGGMNHFVHCTVAQFYVFVGGRGNALCFANYDYDTTTPLPLLGLDFENCIITGYASDEVMGSRGEDETVDFNYRFANSLLCTPAYEADEVVNCLWDTDDFDPHREGNFPEFDLDALTFDFVPVEASQAIGNADTHITSSYYPLDRLGNNRLEDGKSDIGARELIIVKEEN